MSFSADAKNEICKAVNTDCCAIAELFAATFVCGSVCIGSGKTSLSYTTESMAVAKRILQSISQQFHLEAEVVIRESPLKKRNVYSVVVKDAKALFRILQIEDLQAFPPAEMLQNRCCKVAMLRGAFLGGGSVSNPKKNYHLEFVLNSESFAKILQELLLFFEIITKMIHRKQNYVLYLNEGDGIATLLALLGAHTSILELENVRVLKEMRNNVNRAVNCETANINKTVNAAITQTENIQLIDEYLGLDKLSEPLRQAAMLRLDHPEATLQDLCELGGTTKSGMNHRLRKLNTIANALKREESL